VLKIKYSIILLLLLFLLPIAACTKSTPIQVDPTVQPISTSIITPSATQTLTPTYTALPTPTPANTPIVRNSVFLISWDAGRADLINQMMLDGILVNFSNLAANGIQAEYAISVDPSLTASAHSSIATGSYPNKTGIVSNSFHNPNDSFYWYRLGFDEPIDQAEPIWVTASRAGLTSAALFFPGASPSLPGQTADYTVGYGDRQAYSKQVTVPLFQFDHEIDELDLSSYSAPYEGSFVIDQVTRVYLYLIDNSDNETQDYDTVIVNNGQYAREKNIQLGLNEWGSLILIESSYSGCDFLIQRINLDKDPPEITLYHTGVYKNNASPRSLLEGINTKFGFFPAGADDYALEHGWITDEDYFYMLQRSSRWMAEVSAWVYSTYKPDLLLTWQNVFDEAGHAWFMHNQRQPAYSDETAIQFSDYFKKGAIVADQALDTMLDVIDLNHTTLMLISDHGMAAIHTKVYVNTILEKAGLLKLDNRNYVDVGNSKAFAVASGGSVHIYINLIDHESDGFVSPEEYDQVQSQIVESLTSLTDPETGELVFQRVLRQNELASMNLNHENSGDIFALVYPGYFLDGWRGNDDVFGDVDFYGQHGYYSATTEMHTIFIAAGYKVPNSGEVFPPIQIIDYAPTIARLLGFEPAPSIDGELIPAMIYK